MPVKKKQTETYVHTNIIIFKFENIGQLTVILILTAQNCTKQKICCRAFVIQKQKNAVEQRSLSTCFFPLKIVIQ